MISSPETKQLKFHQSSHQGISCEVGKKGEVNLGIGLEQMISSKWGLWKVSKETSQIYIFVIMIGDKHCPSLAD